MLYTIMDIYLEIKIVYSVLKCYVQVHMLDYSVSSMMRKDKKLESPIPLTTNGPEQTSHPYGF